MKLNKFLEGIFSLIISQVFIKVFGVLYSLYLTNKTGFGDQGNAIYMSGYQIYALLLTISSIGVPNAISKLISEKNSIGDYKNQNRILKVAILIFSIIGFMGSITIFTFSEYISKNIIQIPESNLSLKILSPAIFFVSIISVMRGYFNGKGKIYITAKSQFYEQVAKSITTILLVEITSNISNYNTEAMAAVANLSTTIATLYSLIYIYIKFKNEKDIEIGNDFYKDRILNIVRKILFISIPITVSSLVGNLGKNVDSITIVRLLRNIVGEENAKRRYGILSSKVDILVALPLSFNVALSTALVPEISKMRARNDLNGIVNKIKFSLNSTFLIGIPCVFGMYFYSERIFKLLFPNATQGYELLSLASFCIIFSLLIQTISGILQGLGKTKVLLVSSFIGLVIKIIANFVLIPIPEIYEKGAIIGNILSNFISFIILYIALKKNIDIKSSFIKDSLKPTLASIIMIIISNNVYYKLLLFKIPVIISIILSIILAIVVYCATIIIFNVQNIKKFIKVKNVKPLKNKGKIENDFSKPWKIKVFLKKRRILAYFGE